MIPGRVVEQRLAYGSPKEAPLFTGALFDDDASRPDGRPSKPSIRIVGGTLVRLDRP
jgi:hypothetical protein